MAGPNKPALPAAFSPITGLGTPVSFFQASPSSRLVPLVCAGLCGLGAALTLVYGVAASVTAYTRFGVAAAQAMGRSPLLAFWLFVIGGLIFLA